MDISAAMVKELRELTGLPMMECKKALAEAGGDMEKAKEVLRGRGVALAQKRAGRATAQGWVGSYMHFNGKVGAMVELNCETDFVAKSEAFQRLLKELCMQIATTAPRYLDKDAVPPDELKKLTADSGGRPEQEVLAEVALLEQPYVRDPARSVKELVTELAAKTGENIKVRRFVRYALGE